MDKYNHYDGVVNVHSINNREQDEVEISQKLFSIIKYAMDHEDVVISEAVSLFNIALGPILTIWHDARESSNCLDSLAYSHCPVPTSQVEANTVSTNPQNIVLSEENLMISFLEEGMEIDLGGFGKGYAAEMVTDYLDEQEIIYIFNAGNSNLKAGGENPDREDSLFYIGLIRPTIEFTLQKTFYAYIKIPSGISVVTSGNYQRFFKGIEDEVVYHHIIDPRTNFPGGEAMSVTVFCEDGALADIYSTAIYLLSVQEGLSYVDQVEGLEAVWYQTDGTLVYSENFEATYLYMLP
jgi:thiamine biosynthesis lipoprotein